MTIAAALQDAISAVCPVIGVSIGRMNDKTTWRIDYDPSATPDQQQAAQAVLAAFDPTTIAQPAQPLTADQLAHALVAANLLTLPAIAAAVSNNGTSVLPAQTVKL